METLSDRLRKSSKDWGDQSARLFHDTREAGKSFASFLHAEARSWGEYLVDRSRQLGHEGLQAFKVSRQASHETARAAEEIEARDSAGPQTAPKEATSSVDQGSTVGAEPESVQS